MKLLHKAALFSIFFASMPIFGMENKDTLFKTSDGQVIALENSIVSESGTLSWFKQEAQPDSLDPILVAVSSHSLKLLASMCKSTDQRATDQSMTLATTIFEKNLEFSDQQIRELNYLDVEFINKALEIAGYQMKNDSFAISDQPQGTIFDTTQSSSEQKNNKRKRVCLKTNDGKKIYIEKSHLKKRAKVLFNALNDCDEENGSNKITLPFHSRYVSIFEDILDTLKSTSQDPIELCKECLQSERLSLHDLIEMAKLGDYTDNAPLFQTSLMLIDQRLHNKYQKGKLELTKFDFNNTLLELLAQKNRQNIASALIKNTVTLKTEGSLSYRYDDYPCAAFNTLLVVEERKPRIIDTLTHEETTLEECADDFCRFCRYEKFVLSPDKKTLGAIKECDFSHATVCLWDVQTGKIIHRINKPQGATKSTLMFSSNEDIIVFHEHAKSFTMSKVAIASGELTPLHTFKTRCSPPRCYKSESCNLAMIIDHSRTNEKRVASTKFFPFFNEKALKPIEIQDVGGLLCSVNGTAFAHYYNSDNSIKIWNALTGTLMHEIKNPLEGNPIGLALSSNNRFVALIVREKYKSKESFPLKLLVFDCLKNVTLPVIELAVGRLWDTSDPSSFHIMDYFETFFFANHDANLIISFKQNHLDLTVLSIDYKNSFIKTFKNVTKCSLERDSSVILTSMPNLEDQQNKLKTISVSYAPTENLNAEIQALDLESGLFLRYLINAQGQVPLTQHEHELYNNLPENLKQYFEHKIAKEH